MSAELIVSIVSLAATFFIGVITVIINIKISKINNIKDYHEYNKHIYPFELQFRDEEWLYDLIIVRDEFDRYDYSSKKRIAAWFQEYAKTHKLTKLKVSTLTSEEGPVEVEDADEEDTQDEVDVAVVPPRPSKVRPGVVGDDLLKAIVEANHKGVINSQKVIRPGLREYPVRGTITQTPIITDLEDEFDAEDK